MVSNGQYPISLTPHMSRCSICPAVNTCVPPLGSINASYLAIGEAPGFQENKQGRVFIGPTGRELFDTYLPAAGIKPDDIFITNAIQCMPTNSGGKLDPKSKKDMEMLNVCSTHHLYQEIMDVQPRVIITMGNFAARSLDPSIDLDLHHGIPRDSDFGIPIFPMYHPALGVHEPKKMTQIRTDWLRLRKFIAGKLPIHMDPFIDLDYEEATEQDIKDLDPTIPMASDTESSPSIGPYCYTLSQAPGTGRLIRSSDTYLLGLLQQKLDVWESIVIFHNWLYDKKITGGMNLHFPNHIIRDSMIRAFHLGNLPQGLKALSYRELGMTMQDFEDLVLPYSTVECLEYIRNAYAEDWPKPEPKEYFDKDGILKIKRPQSMTTKLKRFYSDYEKNPKKNVIEAWENWEASHLMIEDRMGSFPGLDVAHVPFELVKYYAIRDSDATLRLWFVLEAMKKKAVSGLPQDQWGI